MSPGDVIPIRPEGGADEEDVALHYDIMKGLQIISSKEYCQMAKTAIPLYEGSAVDPVGHPEVLHQHLVRVIA